MSQIPRKVGILLWTGRSYRFYCRGCSYFTIPRIARVWDILEHDFSIFSQPCDGCDFEINPHKNPDMPVIYPRYAFQNQEFGVNLTDDRVMKTPEEFMRDE